MIDDDERAEADQAGWPDERAPDTTPSFDAGHTTRGLRVRLLAFVLLLAVSAVFFDFSGLVQEASRGPLRSSDLSIDGAGLPPGLAPRGHGIERIDGRTYVVLRLAWRTPAAQAGATVPRLRATLLDRQGESLGWQLLEASPNGTATALRGPTYRIQLPQGVRPARIILEGAD